MLALLLQPLSGGDVVNILTVFFAGTAAVVYAWRNPSGSKPTDLTAILNNIHTAMSQLLLNATPKTTTTTTETAGDPPTKTTIATTTGANPALVDTLPLPADGKPLPGVTK
jgi:hypothetical protein